MEEDIYTKAFRKLKPRAAKIFPIKMLHSVLIYVTQDDPASNQNAPFLITWPMTPPPTQDRCHSDAIFP